MINLSKYKNSNNIKYFFESNNNIINEGNSFNENMWKACSEYGILALSIPEKNGGIATSYLESLVNHYSLGYSCHNNGLIFSINNSLIVSAGIFPKYASSQQQEKYLPKLIDGKLIASFALTDSNNGSDSFHTSTRVEKKDDKYVLNGNKMFISNAPIADIFIVIARNTNLNGINSLCAFIVEKNDKGVSVGNEIKKMGLDGCPMGELILNNCVLDSTRLLCNENCGMKIANDALDWERFYEFASHLGTMQRILEETVRYVNSRKTYNRTIGKYQSISNKLVQMKLNIEFGELLLEKIGYKKDQGKNTYMESAMFKLHIGESYAKAALDMLQIHGAYGYSKESGIEKEVRDALAAKIYSGTSEVLSNVIASFLGIDV